MASVDLTANTNILLKLEDNLPGSSVVVNDGNNGPAATASDDTELFNAAGKINSGFDVGTGEYITFPVVDDYGEQFAKADPFSFSMWIKTAVTGSQVTILSNVDAGNDYSGYWIYQDAAGDLINFPFGTETDSNYILVKTTVATHNDNAFHLLIVTYDGSELASGVTISIDNNHYTVGSGLTSVIDGLSIEVARDSVLRLCTLSDGTSGIAAVIDAVYILNKELSSTEKAFLWNEEDGTEDLSGTVGGVVPQVIHHLRQAGGL